MTSVQRRGSSRGFRLAWGGLALALLVATGCDPGDHGNIVLPAGSRLPPPPGKVLYGVNLDWANDSPKDYSARLGAMPRVFVEFTHFPLRQQDKDHIDWVVGLVAEQNAGLLLTLEPFEGLEQITPEVAADFGARISRFNAMGVPVWVRFAHEMNGSWYPWCQQPTLYIEKFRLVAKEVHDQAPEAAMLWAPNYGGFYPFRGGPWEARPGTADHAVLDTNGDGRLSMEDDPYGPYYPGDDVVDWVGMTIYHWGSSPPWGANVLPEEGKFEAQLTGNYRGTAGDDRVLPDFYAEYAEARQKPLAIPETAAFTIPNRGGADPAEIKRAWWPQILDPDLYDRLPRLGMISWFEWVKFEAEVNDIVDWSVTHDPDLAAEFFAAFPSWLYAEPLP